MAVIGGGGWEGCDLRRRAWRAVIGGGVRCRCPGLNGPLCSPSTVRTVILRYWYSDRPPGAAVWSLRGPPAVLSDGFLLTSDLSEADEGGDEDGLGRERGRQDVV